MEASHMHASRSLEKKINGLKDYIELYITNNVNGLKALTHEKHGQKTSLQANKRINYMQERTYARSKPQACMTTE